MNAREKYERYLLNTYESPFVGFLPADSEEGVVVKTGCKLGGEREMEHLIRSISGVKHRDFYFQISARENH